MSYDIAFRFQRALDPSALVTIATASRALDDAALDARNAGHDPERDPAVILLARHLGRIACGDDGQVRADEDAPLRQACIARIEELRRKPALVALARKGVAYDPQAKSAFLREARQALARLARALGLSAGDYDLRTNPGGIAVSGEATLHGEELYVQIALGAMGQGREILYRRCRGRKDYCGDRNHFTDIALAIAPERLAALLVRDLQLSAASAREPELI